MFYELQTLESKYELTVVDKIDLCQETVFFPLTVTLQSLSINTELLSAAEADRTQYINVSVHCLLRIEFAAHLTHSVGSATGKGEHIFYSINSHSAPNRKKYYTMLKGEENNVINK